MCGFSFTVFLSAFQLLPTAPFHILELGGGTSAAGLFLGFLTYASAISAPLTGTLADRVGTRRVLIIAGVAITLFTIVYAIIPSYKVMLALVLVHGVFWSGLLTGSAAYMTNILPEGRRAEGIAYWGLSTIAAIAVAPSLGFWVYQFGWRALCLESCRLERADGDHRVAPSAAARRPGSGRRPPRPPHRVAGSDPVVHAVPVLVRLRRHHELHCAVRGRQRRHAEGHLSHRARAHHPGDAAVLRAHRRPLGLPAGVPAVPGADYPRAGLSDLRRDAVLAGHVGD